MSLDNSALTVAEGCRRATGCRGDMTDVGWVKLDGSFYDHPKVLAAGDAAIGLWARALTYAARHERDGVVTADDLRWLRGRARDITRLVDVGLLYDLSDGTYRIDRAP